MEIIVITPKPPACINSKIINCPQKLQADIVDTVTSPVTHTDVVAVKRASMYGTATPPAPQNGMASNPLPAKINIRKLSIIL